MRQLHVKAYSLALASMLVSLGCKSGSDSADPATSSAPNKSTETVPNTSATNTSDSTSSSSTATSTSGAATSTSTDDDDDNQDDGDDNEQAAEDTIRVTGHLALILGLQSATAVTHVVATNADSNEQVVAEVDSEGNFSLDVPTDGNFVMTYIDANATGEDMLVSIFGSGELDTLATNGDSGDVALGDVDVTGEQATATLSEAALLAAIGISAEAASTLGAADDVCLRYSNPDINGDGQIDALQGQRFILDFHNRFNVLDADNNALSMQDLKNAFPPDDAALQFTGSGIVPWFDDDAYLEPVQDYTWTFSSAAELNDTCANVAGINLNANTACELSLANNNQTVSGIPSIELKAAVPGTYILNAGGRTFTWTQVAVSDFSGGEGFIALFIRADVDESDKLTGFSWRWRRRVDGAWTQASAEELRLLVAGSGGYISLKIDGDNSKSLGVVIPLEPEGTVDFATAAIGGDSGVVHLPNSNDITESVVRAGLDWSRVLSNPGISYDDKLGMRFFFSFNGSN